MTIETAGAPPAADDFDGAFAQFSAPEPADTTAAPAAPAAGDPPAAAGGGDGTDTNAAAGGAGDAGSAGAGSDTGAGADAKPGETVAPPNPAPAAPAGDGPAAGTPPAGGDGGAGTPPPAAAVEPPKPAVDADAILNKLGQLVEAAGKPAEPAKPAEAKPEGPYTPEQAAEITQYEKDWPDVSRIEGMKRQGEYKQLLDFVFAEVRKYVDPMREAVDSLAGRTHLSDVKTVITDYSDTLRQQVIDWSKTQPAYLQPAYEHVINSGTVEEVKDLVDRFRQATGQAAPAPGGASAAPANQGAGRTNELSGAAKEAASALAPVESKRSEVVQSGDPNSFEDAWKQFSKDL